MTAARRAERVDVVGLVLLDREARVLLERRAQNATCYAALWDTPGGKIEAGETAAAALRREIVEELGIDLLDCELHAVFDHTDPTSGRPYRHHVFRAESARGEVAPLLGQTLAWMTLHEIATTPAVSPIVRLSLDVIGVSFSRQESDHR